MTTNPLTPSGDTKRPVGRPPKPPGEATEARSIRLPQWAWEWLYAHPDGASATVLALIEQARTH